MPKSSQPIKPDRPIAKVETTTETITGRGGLALFSQYLFSCNILELLEDRFGYLRKSQKGLDIWRLFHQGLCFFFDGSNFHLSRFDELKLDRGYAAAIATQPTNMGSTSQFKRFFNMFAIGHYFKFRKILRKLFIWRLQNEQPDVIELTCDTMPMNNDQAKKREGASPTYKKYKGFQPLHLIWNGFIIDAIFRGGKKHGNANRTALNMILNMIKLIRTEYKSDVMIVIRLDSGFFDQVNFDRLDAENVYFIATGKIYNFVKEQVNSDSPEWGIYESENHTWEYLEFGYRCQKWQRFYRAFYTVPQNEPSGQLLLDFARPENVILTNIGINPKPLEALPPQSRQQKYLSPDFIIGSHHQRGADELPHRGLKDFGTEKLPFQRFLPNSAYYYVMLIAFSLFESFKRDVLSNQVAGIKPLSYASTVRRRVIDFAAKIIYHGKQWSLKVTAAVMNRLQLPILWQRSLNPPPIVA